MITVSWTGQVKSERGSKTLKITKTLLLAIGIVIAPYIAGLFSSEGFWFFLGLKGGVLGTIFSIAYFIDKKPKRF